MCKDMSPFLAIQPHYFLTGTAWLCKENPAAVVETTNNIILGHSLKEPFNTRQAIQSSHHYTAWTGNISTVVFPWTLASLLKRKKKCWRDMSGPWSSDHRETQIGFSDYKPPATLHIWFCWEAYAKLHRAILLPPIHIPVFRLVPRPTDTPATVSQPGLCP